MPPLPDSLPDVTVVIPNWNGRRHLDVCLGSLDRQAYPGQLDVVLVDNGSVDGSVEFVRRRFPRVRVLANARNEGFSRACNAGARAGGTALVAFLNNDMRVDPSWLAELVRGLDGEVRCAGSLILSWDGSTVHYGGGGMNFHGIGLQLGLGDQDVQRRRTAADTLFACGGAMVIDRQVFLDAGGFDEEFFAYYEDVDLGWRLWVLGERVRFQPSSVAYHHHSATSSRVDLHRIRRLQVRNPLLTIFKNYDDENLRRVLPAALLLSLRRTKYMLAVNERAYQLAGAGNVRRGPFAARLTRALGKLRLARVRRAGVADVLAVDDLLAGLDRFAASRRWIQERRRRPDAEIVPLFCDPFWRAEAPAEYQDAQASLARFFGLDELFRARPEAPVPASRGPDRADVR